MFYIVVKIWSNLLSVFDKKLLLIGWLYSSMGFFLEH